MAKESLDESVRKAQEKYHNAHDRVYSAEEWAKTFRWGGRSRATYDAIAYDIKLEEARAEADLAYLQGLRDGKRKRK